MVKECLKKTLNKSGDSLKPGKSPKPGKSTKFDNGSKSRDSPKPGDGNSPKPGHSSKLADGKGVGLGRGRGRRRKQKDSKENKPLGTLTCAPGQELPPPPPLISTAPTSRPTQASSGLSAYAASPPGD